MLALRLCLLHRQAGAVIVENHLNMVRPLNRAPKVSPSALAAVLNSPIIDRVFRCISGSVAVSAFELEALPLPTVRQMAAIERLVGAGASREAVNAALTRILRRRGEVSLPPLPPVAEIHAHLQAIFPEGTPHRSNSPCFATE